nr:MAG: hypothetical protein 1 [Regressovirinae sp.]
MISSLMDFATLAKWIIKTIRIENLNSITNFFMKQGKSYWIQFKSWLWGLNCDLHEALVRKIVPIMPVVEDTFDELERRVDQIADAEKFEECIEIDVSRNEEYNQDFGVYPSVITCDSDYENAISDNETDSGVELTRPDLPAKKKFDRKLAAKQRHKIRDGFLQRACTAVEIQLRTKHGLVPTNELNEQALRMSAIEICSRYNMNDIDTQLLTMKPVYMAMIPDQQQMDAIRIIYNSEVSGRHAAVEALRSSSAYGHFKSGHYC